MVLKEIGDLLCIGYQSALHCIYVSKTMGLIHDFENMLYIYKMHSCDIVYICRSFSLLSL